MAGTHRITHISFPDMEETSYHDITSGIAEGSLLLDEILLTNGLNLGETNSNRFEVQLYGIVDVSGQKIVVWQVDADTSEEIPIFVGYVDSCKQNKSGYYREIVAYDVFYSTLDKNISSWWNDFWDTTGATGSTFKVLRTELLSHMGIETVTLPVSGFLHDNLTLKRLAYQQTLTFGAILSMICVWQGTIPNINREGKLEFLTLGTNAIDESSNINRRDSLFEEFTTTTIDAVWVYDSTYKVVGWGGSGSQNPYRIQKNLLNDGIDDLHTAAAELYEAIKHISYVPGDFVHIISNPELKLGDKLDFGLGYTYIFENILSGSILIEQETISKGEQVLQEPTNWNSDLSSIQGQLGNNEIQYYLFYNTQEIKINNNEEKKIIDIRFTSNSKTVVIFQAEILLESETTEDDGEYYDNEVTIRYVYNDLTLTDYKPTETYTDGDHIMHLLYYFTIQQARLDHLEVYMKSVGGSVTIKIGRLRSCIYGQNLAASDMWDGTINIKQILSRISLGHPNAITARNLIATPVVVTQTPETEELIQEIPRILLSGSPHGIVVRGITEDLSLETSE